MIDLLNCSITSLLVIPKLIISGEHGAGKSTLLNKLYNFLIKEKEYITVFIKQEPDQLKYLDKIYNIFQQYSDKSNCIILIDGLNLTSGNIRAVDYLNNSKCKIIITTISNKLKDCLHTFESKTVKPLDLDDSFNIISNYDQSKGTSHLSAVKNIITNQPELADILNTPLIVNFVIEYLETFTNNVSYKNFDFFIKRQLQEFIRKKCSGKPLITFSSNYKIEFKKPSFKAEKNDFIVLPAYRGLGDILWYSHLPHIAKQSGKFNRVLVSDACVYRNREYKDLIWELNPYVDGYCLESNHEEKIQIAREKYHFAQKNVNSKRNLLDCIMLGLDLDDDLRFHEPEIYYEPTKIKELEGKTLYDPNYISNAHVGINDYFSVEKFMIKNNITIDFCSRIFGQNGDNQKGDVEDWVFSNSIMISIFDKYIGDKSIFDFIDVLSSVRDVYCLTTGTATLCSAIGVPATVLISTNLEECHHSRINKYINITHC